MATIKHTKNELKAQREALTRFTRFLPMLQLKKQQLHAEIQAIDTRLAAKNAEEEGIRTALDAWLSLFSTDPASEWVHPAGAAPPPPIETLIALESVEIDEGNIAGINIPVLKDVRLTRQPVDIFQTPTWYDEGLEVLETLMRLRVEREILEKQKSLLAEEYRTTSQRVNLFEKVKIPECSENIRVIKIFLGDQQTAGVVRAKTAKSRVIAFEGASS